MLYELLWVTLFSTKGEVNTGMPSVVFDKKMNEIQIQYTKHRFCSWGRIALKPSLKSPTKTTSKGVNEITPFVSTEQPDAQSPSIKRSLNELWGTEDFMWHANDINLFDYLSKFLNRGEIVHYLLSVSMKTKSDRKQNSTCSLSTSHRWI